MKPIVSYEDLLQTLGQSSLLQQYRNRTMSKVIVVVEGKDFKAPIESGEYYIRVVPAIQEGSREHARAILEAAISEKDPERLLFSRRCKIVRGERVHHGIHTLNSEDTALLDKGDYYYIVDIEKNEIVHPQFAFGKELCTIYFSPHQNGATYNA